MPAAKQRARSSGSSSRGRGSSNTSSRSANGSSGSSRSASRSSGSSRTASRSRSQSSSAKKRSSSAASRASNGASEETKSAGKTAERASSNGRSQEGHSTITSIGMSAAAGALGVAGGVLLGRTALQRNRKFLGVKLPVKIDLSDVTQQIGAAGKQFGKLAGEVRAVREKAEQVGRAIS